MNECSVTVIVQESVQRVRLERPERGNALGPLEMHAIVAALEHSATSETIRVVVIEAEGRNFCTGAELGRREERASSRRTGELMRRLDGLAHRIPIMIWRHPLPVVAAVQGHAVGLGCQLALASDFVVARDDAEFSAPFVRRGFSADSASSFILPRVLGLPRARRMLLLGQSLSAEELAAAGVLTMASADDFGTMVDDLVEVLRVGPTVAIGLSKRLVNTNVDQGIERASELESLAVELAVRSPDFAEGRRAFSERRASVFTGL